LGEIQLARGEFEPAAVTFTRVLERAPDASGARYRLGMALAGMGDTEAAREALHLALAAGGFEDEERARAELARLESATDVKAQ
jgi:Flp pilus assembly protein TadD